MIFELLKEICQELEAKNIPYMLSGSLAMTAYTVPRMTRDIDIIINLQESDTSKFIEIFKEGYYIHEQSVKDEIKRRGLFNIIDFKSGLKVDFIVRKNTKFSINEFERRIMTNAYGFDTYIVTKEDLIIAKINWIQQLQSDTQLNDIKNLLSSGETDLEYIKNWCKQLSLNTFNLI